MLVKNGIKITECGRKRPAVVQMAQILVSFRNTHCHQRNILLSAASLSLSSYLTSENSPTCITRRVSPCKRQFTLELNSSNQQEDFLRLSEDPPPILSHLFRDFALSITSSFLYLLPLTNSFFIHELHSDSISTRGWLLLSDLNMLKVPPSLRKKYQSNPVAMSKACITST